MDQTRNRRLCAACGLLCLWAVAASAQTDARPELPARLTLPQAVELALRQSTLLRLAQAQMTQAEGRSQQSTSGLYPQISLGVGDTYQMVNLRAQGIRFAFAPARVGPFQSFDGRGTVSQNLFHAPLWLGSRAGKMRLDASRNQAADARELVVLSVVSAYVQALRAETQSAALAAQVETAERLHQITVDRFQGGIANALEVKRARQQANNLRQVWLEAQNGATVAKLQLANLLQARISTGFELADISGSYETPQISPESALARAAETRMDLKAATQAVRAAELTLRSVKAQRLPTLQLQGSFGQSGDSPAHNLDVYRVQGVVSVPLFTGHRISGETREAEGRLEEARANLAAVRSQVETDVLAASAGLDAAGREVEVAEESSRLAKEELDLALARYQGGVSDNTEVVNAQDRIARAEENLVRARFNRNLARANLHRALGIAEKAYSR